MTKKLLMIVNSPAFFMSHFSPVAERAKTLGYDVHVASMDGVAVDNIKKLGVKHTVIPVNRSGKGLLGELRSLIAIWLLIWKVKPDVLHLMTIKPVLYGGVAAKFSPVKGVLSVITGLGFVFLGEGFKAKVLRNIISRSYRLALSKRNLRVLFENPDDCKVLSDLGAFDVEKARIIRGAGVDLHCYSFSPEKMGRPIVCLAARLLRDKGVVEFVEAAKILKKKGVDARFQLIGDADPGNPATISDQEIEQWKRDGEIELLGYRTDISQLFSDANIVVLPSYREGLPKVLLEAAACGRAVVTTDVPGCRHAIIPDVTGLLVPVKNAEALSDAIELLLSDTSLRSRMGKAGRKLAEEDFAIGKIVHQYLEIYKELWRND